jgi:tetratricopeptide (TPR) repeat protein
MKAALTALALLVPAATLAATDVAPAACPVDDTDVDVTILLSSDSLLGHDRDLCPHANLDDDVRPSVSSCSTCGFAGTLQEFQQTVPAEVAARIKKELVPAKTPWERYANRARILEWSQALPARIGESWLRAGWSVRLEGRPVGAPLSKAFETLVRSVPETAGEDPILGPAKAIDARLVDGKTLVLDDRAVAFYASGSLWRSRGELAAAEERYARSLEVAVESGELAAALKDAIARDRASIELEQSYLKKALAYFRAALNAGEKVPKSQRPMLAFLAAECARRTGEREEAQRFYKIAQTLEGSESSAELKTLTTQGLADTAPAGKSKSTPKSKAN